MLSALRIYVGIDVAAHTPAMIIGTFGRPLSDTVGDIVGSVILAFAIISVHVATIFVRVKNPA